LGSVVGVDVEALKKENEELKKAKAELTLKVEELTKKVNTLLHDEWSIPEPFYVVG
jgi:prefoldin subunit 5